MAFPFTLVVIVFPFTSVILVSYATDADFLTALHRDGNCLHVDLQAKALGLVKLKIIFIP
jgi:hypothetical protein